ncbi:hypothetical protein C8R48DRAFT_780003 [Suillus tomentosus]|nr:hypothetical protein C8R48DRAFT_781328 [Suillus tomentosus]KAG1845268.1 hypothetical protein C8R48DRAFT_780003 [Suillus tomentosus]
MAPKYKTAKERYEARLQSKRAHYQRNKTIEQAKSRTRWRTHRHFDSDVVTLFSTLDKLSDELGYKSGVPEARIVQSRVSAVLQRIDDEGWTLLRPELDDAVIALLGLHERATKLYETAQQLGCKSVAGYHLLLKQSRELVDLMGRRLVVEREVISIIDDGGVEAYDQAMLTDSLSWHWQKL